MSTHPYKCEACEVDCTFDHAGKFPEDDPKDNTYGVAWRCPKCDEVSLDLCPLGPVEPIKGQTRCLNCGAKGAEKDDAAPCPDCGMSKPEMLAFLHLDGDASTRTYEKAEAAFDQGLYRHGFAILDALLLEKEESEHAKLWEAKGTQYQILRLNHAAIRAYRRAVERGSGPLVEIALACALADTKDKAGATAVYDALIEKAKEGEAVAIAHANRGNLREAAGDIEGATEDYERAIQGDKGRVTHYQNYIRLLARKKKWSEAFTVAERGLSAVTAKEDRAALLIEKARSLNEQDKGEEALVIADEALELVPDYPRGLYMRGWALGLLGRLEEGILTIEKLLEIDPNNKDGARALAMLNAGRVKPKRPWWKVWG